MKAQDIRISDEFWTRKWDEWETELRTVEGERVRLEHPRPCAAATGEKILELAKQAEFLYNAQDPTEQRRLLETVLSNCTFDRGTLSPTYSSPSTCSFGATQREIGAPDNSRTSRTFRTPRTPFLGLRLDQRQFALLTSI